MDFLHGIVDVFLHLDRHLGEIIQTYGTWTYAILFCVVFLETGLVATPFLPGDSLLFAAGAFAAIGSLDLPVLLVLLAVAAIAGDSLNYWIGRRVGPRVFTDRVRWLKREHLLRTQEFYERHGGKTIVLARFVPIVRTLAPITAGAARMSYGAFTLFNVIGAVAWGVGLTLLGYGLGQFEIIQKLLEPIFILIALASVSPMFIEWYKRRRAAKRAAGEPAPEA